MKLAITMAQSYRRSLEVIVELLGGGIIAQGFADSSTSWTVIAEFPKGTRPGSVQSAIWERCKGAQVTVAQQAPVRRGRGAVTRHTDGTLSCTCTPDFLFYGGEGCDCGALQPQ